jgi:hypothetical protein
MWICAACGTEAQKPETCSGCGSPMKPFDQPPKEERYQFVLIVHRSGDGDSEAYGPFPSVMSADQWADSLDHRDYEVVLMENPNERET